MDKLCWIYLAALQVAASSGNIANFTSLKTSIRDSHTHTHTYVAHPHIHAHAHATHAHKNAANTANGAGVENISETS